MPPFDDHRRKTVKIDTDAENFEVDANSLRQHVENLIEAARRELAKGNAKTRASLNVVLSGHTYSPREAPPSACTLVWSYLLRSGDSTVGEGFIDKRFWQALWDTVSGNAISTEELLSRLGRQTLKTFPRSFGPRFTVEGSKSRGGWKLVYKGTQEEWQELLNAAEELEKQRKEDGIFG